MRNFFYLIAILAFFSCAGNKTKNNESIEQEPNYNEDTELDSLNVTITNPKIYNLTDSIDYSDFNVVVEDQMDNFTSADSSYSRKYLKGKRKIKVFLNKEEKIRIFETIRKYDFFDLPDVLIVDKCIMPSPSTKITIQIGRKKKSVYCAGWCQIIDKKIEFRYEKIINEIYGILNNKTEINQLKDTDIRSL